MRMLVVAGMITIAGVADAAPLAEVWRVPGACRGGLVRTATHVFATGDQTGLAGYTVDTGKRTFALKSETGIYFSGGVGDIVFHYKDEGETLGAYDATGKRLWDQRTDAAAVSGDGLAFSVRDEKKGTFVVSHRAARTGATTWSTPIPFDDEESLDGMRANDKLVVVMLGKSDGDSTLRGFDAKTGKALWTASTKAKHVFEIAGTHVVAIGGEVVYAFATANGKLAYTSPKLAAVMGLAVGGGRRLYLTGAGKDGLLVSALDIGARSPAWKLPLKAMGAVHGLAGAHVVVHDEIDGVRLASVASGAVVPKSAFGIAHPSGIAVGRKPMIVACDSYDLVALDPAGTVSTTEETATVTGTIVCKRCGPKVKTIRFRIGATHGETDEAGRFTAKVTGRGRLAVQTDVNNFADTDVWVTPDTPNAIVTFSGKQSYALGTIETRPNN